ncbi:hypothetical protein BDN71DRAFT_1563932 [Pleurotus eryngii]|uniref:Uncharacterized protein n=1 Tax=Pleurotus eryngii TaxID=5323 RepID=A0A9P5ZZ50_PLEER|nr:hypothetical protein BDN71DRAFT_1563932 [Pleurotus eryngii]
MTTKGLPVLSTTVDDDNDPESAGGSRKRARRANQDAAPSRHWYPWEDRITCTLDILMHLPRSVFSHRQLDLFLWLLKVNQVDDVPSVKTMQSMNAMLQKLCGIDTMPYKGALGHKYYVNNLSQIIAQEMANPRVRPHLAFYPEDAGQRLSEARQAARWLHEAPGDQLTPMARIGSKDFYVYEPAMLTDGSICMPSRWFLRGGTLFAKCWSLLPIDLEHGGSWRVVMRNDFEVSERQFLKNFPDLESDRHHYGLSTLCHITDIFDPITQASTPWTLTDPTVGNRWRQLAKGSRVVAFPLWMYCDDTSGNLSKKWNEHNSFLVLPAGLPRMEAQKEYNIHFLSTSNLAPPLEMLDGIVEQLEQAQANGIWAWDCVYGEPILVIPMILALLGDNPMQSEFASCWVKGSDALDADVPTNEQQGNPGSDAGDSGSEVASDASGDQTSTVPVQKRHRRKGKFKESLQQIVDRVGAFIKIGKLRSKHETVNSLRSQFTQASTPGSKTRVKAMRTETGIKDTHQLHFVEQLFDSVKGKHGEMAKQAAIDTKLRNFPPNVTSPVWRINGLDPHQDTPVEILHVILLGFVKYLWRDLVQNQLKNKSKELELLQTRISCFDVSGLGISPLAGTTLVQYSGSLTGRDFRAIAQVAPFVAYDLVSAECLATWVSLSKLIPLVWQPDIFDVNSHIALLRSEIDYFLLCTMRWTARWFNKPKFHILAFESFNAIIRAKSVHSNRHAPSRDIAFAFAQGNRVRHLLSGGLFPDNPAANQSHQVLQHNLVASASTVTTYLGLSSKTTDNLCPTAALQVDVKTYNRVVLVNGDACTLGAYVIAHDEASIGSTYVGVVREIVRRRDDISPPALLLQRMMMPQISPTYGMPVISLLNTWHLVSFRGVLCTVNVSHNCAGSQSCQASGKRPVFQERERTSQTQAAIIHHHTPDNDYILNLGQMRDAAHVQKFRPFTPPLDAKLIIEEAAVREFNQREMQKENTVSTTSRLRMPAAQGTRSRLVELRGT